jgi:putative oxidoreductase
MKRIFDTPHSSILAFQRLVLAVVIGAHGAQKLLGWFGGYGFDGTLSWFTHEMGTPAFAAVLVILSDSLGMVALVAGLATRLVAAGATATMLGAIFMVHAKNGFFMNWSGKLAGEGFELHLLALGLAIPLVLAGGGAWSLDRLIAGRLRAASPRPSATAQAA